MRQTNVTLLSINNILSLFGQRARPSVVFIAAHNGKKCSVAISYESLQRQGFDTSADGLRRLKGCTVDVRDFIDSDGVLQETVARIEKSVIAFEKGETKGQLVMLNSLNSTVTESQDFQEKSLEIISAAKAKSDMLERDRITAKKREALLARLANSVNGVVVAETTNEEEKPKEEQQQEQELDIQIPDSENTPF